jgi:hypothetical protein
MECERLARKAGVLLGQAGSIEVSQIFTIISETTYDAAQEGRNPATAFWTAETERVLRSPHVQAAEADLQEQRAASVDPYLALVNRIYESHAKVDGWLRFLAGRERGNSVESLRLTQLQQSLLDLKKKAEDAQDVLLQLLAQKNVGTGSAKTAAEEAWEKCREAFTTYHEAVKNEFARTRDLVSAQWESMGSGGSQSNGSGGGRKGGGSKKPEGTPAAKRSAKKAGKAKKGR